MIRGFANNASARALASASALALLVNFIGKGTAFVTNVVVARSIDLVSFGVYGTVVSAVALFAVVSTLGTQQFLLRHASLYYANADFESLKFISKRCVSVAAVSFAILYISVVALFVAAGAFAPVMAERYLPDTQVMIVTALLAPLVSLGLFRQQLLRAMRRIIAFRFSETVVMNVVILSCVILFSDLFPNDNLLGLGSRLVGTTVAFFFGAWLLRRSIAKFRRLSPKHAENASSISETTRLKTMLPSSLYMMISSLSQGFLGMIDVALVGALAGAKEAGVYFAITRLVLLMGFGLTGVNQILAPLASSSTGSKEGLSQPSLARASMFISLGFSLVTLVGFITFQDMLFELFKIDVEAGRHVFFVLVAAQLLQAFLGPLDTILVMTGREHWLGRVQILVLAIGACLHILLTPSGGAFGGAIATLITIFVWKALVLCIWLADSRKAALESA